MAKITFPGTSVKKACLVALGLVLLLSWLYLIPPTSVVATPDVVKWSRANIPTEGKAGNCVLADGSDVRHLTMAVDGTLYCYANPSGTDYTLFKSTDGGYSWSYTGKVEDSIVDIATAVDDASVVYYVTIDAIYKSTDAGSSFTPLPPNSGGAGNNNIEITSIDVARQDDNNLIAVGTRDKDGSEYGGVYTLDESDFFANWVDTNIGSYDVYAVAFSPNFDIDRQLVAVVTDETDTFVTTKINSAEWGEITGDARLDKDNSGVSITISNSAAIVFPSDYDATPKDYVLFVGIDAGSNNGDVYMINGVGAPGSSIATDLNVGSAYGLSNVDITTLAVTGDATDAYILAGAGSSVQVYFSSDGGIRWKRSTKPPTGESKTYVLMAPDFTSHGIAYAATSGTDSAFSYTIDGSITWNQVSLIDTVIGIGNMLDLAISPSYSQDNTLFMLTRNGKDSLWRSLDGGTRWERVYSSSLANVDCVDMVELSPQYGNGSQMIFIAGTSNGNGAIWKSEDSGQNFIRRTTGASLSIKTWAVVDDDTLFIGRYDGSNGLVCRSISSGLSYSDGAEAGNHSLNSIVVSPNYDQDKTILVGNTYGWVYWSSDNGESFESLGQQLPLSSTDVGKVTVAFAPEYSSNKIVYAASDAKATADSNERIYRFKIGTDTSWESIDSALAEDSIINQLVVSADGTLYAADSMADGGMERCLNPTYSSGSTFETVTRGLDDGAKLSGLWLCENRLWSIDAANTRLVTFTDSLTQPVSLTSPVDEAAGMGIIIDSTIRDVSLDWESLEGATSYKWQLDHDTDFSTVPTGFEDTTEASSARLPALEPATRYYWRVRATEPVLSPWSAKWSFTDTLGSEVIAPHLDSPEAGASGLGLKPVFQWSAVAGADGYELLVASNASFANPVVVRAGDYVLPATAWQCDASLNYDTTYYWKIRATGSDTYSVWSAVGAFTTESSPSPQSSPPPSPPPQSSSPSSLNPSSLDSLPQESPPLPPPAPAQPTTPDWTGWLMYLGGALLFIMVAILITMIILTVRIGKL